MPRQIQPRHRIPRTHYRPCGEQRRPHPQPNEKLLNNLDLCLLVKVSTRALQRSRSKKLLPFMMISGKAYYRASDVREFIKERFDVGTLRKLEKEHGANK